MIKRRKTIGNTAVDVGSTNWSDMRSNDHEVGIEADPKRIFVIRADGTVIIHQSRDKHFHDDFAKIRLLSGDAVIVPEKLRVSSKMNDLLQVSQFATQTALTAAALSMIQRECRR